MALSEEPRGSTKGSRERISLEEGGEVAGTEEVVSGQPTLKPGSAPR